ncbi:DUF7470 family protein [Halalkalirubrum salinum]|uniref:DUF7470 family protein n=1 Tax=Halalkalirubrum salinum TaxID=2563889 RepID=UPI0010C137A9|nr:hypothetical protein [Halalkalirubrum salinum]
MNAIDTLGYVGIVGIVLILVGVGVISVRDPVIGAGMMFALAGVALVARGIAANVMRLFGMG